MLFVEMVSLIFCFVFKEKDQHTSFPAVPDGRMFSWVNWAECSFALRRSAAMLDALRSAAIDDEEEGGSGKVDGGCTGPSTGGAVWRKRAAAVEALVRGPILEKSLKRREPVPVIQCTALINMLTPMIIQHNFSQGYKIRAICIFRCDYYCLL